MTGKERRRILAEARALLEKKVEAYTPPPVRRFVTDWPLPEPEPKLPPRGLDTKPPAPAASIDMAAIDALIERRVAAAISVAHSNLMTACAAVAEEVASIHERLEDRLAAETQELKISMAGLSSALGDLRAMIQADAERRAEIADRLLPAPRRDLN
jgi:hypothetical protein